MSGDGTSTSESSELLVRLRQHIEDCAIVEQQGPNSEEGQDWLARASALLRKADRRLAAEFDHLRRYVGLPLSGDMLTPMWANMVGLVRQAAADLELREGGATLADERDPPRIFISHSSSDATVAEKLVALFRSALNLGARDIRCTSVEGHRLPAGADIDDVLRAEILSVPVFIGLVSHASFESAYVLFELGARWGANRHLIPVLAPGVNASILKGPIAGLNAVSCGVAAQLHQLVQDVSEFLGVESERPDAYQSIIEEIVAGGSRGQPTRPPAQTARPDDYDDAEAVIRASCEEQWADDYRMRSHCIQQQTQAVTKLKTGRPPDIPEDVFAGIRARCAVKWPRDYRMRLHCEEQQLNSYRHLST